jgi:prophage regulatory protein
MMAERRQTAGESERATFEKMRPRAATAPASTPPVDERSTVSRLNERGAADRLLDKRAVEERTSLDITTIYRRIKVGAFPQPVRLGRRRVAWRESDIAQWQDRLEVGVRKG